MSYPGTRRDIFNGEGKGPTVRRDILLEATQALFGVIRLATASEIAAGAVASGSKGPAVVDLSLANQHILTPIKNLQTSLTNEISARTNGDNSLWTSVNGIQNQINNGLGECLVWHIPGYEGVYVNQGKYPAVYLPTGGTYFVFYRASYHVDIKPGFLFIRDWYTDEDGYTSQSDMDNGWKAAIMAGGSKVPVGSGYTIDSQYYKVMGSWAWAFKVGSFTQYSSGN